MQVHSQNPEVWISEIEVIRRQFKKIGKVITEKDVMIHIIKNLP
jgi:hypothetical protein